MSRVSSQMVFHYLLCSSNNMLIWNLLWHTFLRSNDHLKVKSCIKYSKKYQIKKLKLFVEIILYNSEFFTPVFVLGPVVVFVHTDRVIDSV